MSNPWEDILLDDYEEHMKLESVKQLQTLHTMMKSQLTEYPVTSVMILGIAGGNGLSHINPDKFEKVYGVDINASYLQKVKERYSNLSNILECICIDLIKDYHKLKRADLVIANLLIEYIGYEIFKKVIQQVKPEYVSCIIQINEDNAWVSDSPFLHAFDRLDEIHYQIKEDRLDDEMMKINYYKIHTMQYPLPNGKKLVQLDYKKQLNKV